MGWELPFSLPVSKEQLKASCSKSERCCEGYILRNQITPCIHKPEACAIPPQHSKWKPIQPATGSWRIQVSTRTWVRVMGSVRKEAGRLCLLARQNRKAVFFQVGIQAYFCKYMLALASAVLQKHVKKQRLKILLKLIFCQKMRPLKQKIICRKLPQS